MSKSIIVITGASSGIGMEFALQIDAHLRKTDEIWLIARRKEKLIELSRRMRNNTRILSMDITKEGQLERLADTLEDNDCRIRMLVNCAGFGVIGDFAESHREDQAGMIRLNCEALTNITHCCLPYMCRNARIIQVASSAAFVPQPGFAVYAASKSYVNSFALGLREELKERRIYVTSVCPGPVDTAFFERAEANGSVLTIKKWVMADVQNVVEKALRDACHKKAKSVYSFPIQGFEIICKMIPHGILLPMIKAIKMLQADEPN